MCGINIRTKQLSWALSVFTMPSQSSPASTHKSVTQIMLLVISSFVCLGFVYHPLRFLKHCEHVVKM